ncbi:hypothetical protein NVP1101O_006 [Vibrio phage 1.101.O._10N.261.45.C6]|nr:hypothetical protein NVP1101O_006 [Vibrio phage 1.101.O._10N.261.45.C6]
MSKQVSNKRVKAMIEDVTCGIYKHIPHPNKNKSCGLLFCRGSMPVSDHFAFTRRYYKTVTLTADQMKGVKWVSDE